MIANIISKKKLKANNNLRMSYNNWNLQIKEIYYTTKINWKQIIFSNIWFSWLWKAVAEQLCLCENVEMNCLGNEIMYVSEFNY